MPSPQHCIVDLEEIASKRRAFAAMHRRDGNIDAAETCERVVEIVESAIANVMAEFRTTSDQKTPYAFSGRTPHVESPL